jgi:hypothetical protein
MASFAGHERAMQKSQVDLDRPFLAAMEELVHIRIVGAVNLVCRPVPHDLALVDHRDVVGDQAALRRDLLRPGAGLLALAAGVSGVNGAGV